MRLYWKDIQLGMEFCKDHNPKDLFVHVIIKIHHHKFDQRIETLSIKNGEVMGHRTWRQEEFNRHTRYHVGHKSPSQMYDLLMSQPNNVATKTSLDNAFIQALAGRGIGFDLQREVEVSLASVFQSRCNHKWVKDYYFNNRTPYETCSVCGAKKKTW